MSTQNPGTLWFDIETGGVTKESSLLSIASGTESSDIRTVYVQPVKGSQLSRFSEQQILPQLKGKSLTSERDALQGFISQLEKNKSSSLGGYNLSFDLGFLQHRARMYGLENQFTQSIRGRSISDPSNQVKQIIASSLVREAEAGTFSNQLDSLSWQEATQKYKKTKSSDRPSVFNTLRQAQGYLEASSSEDRIFRGWKLEDVYNLVQRESGGAATTTAHQAASDVQMTQRVFQSVESGEFQKLFSRKDITTDWLNLIETRKAVPRIEGSRLVNQLDITKLGSKSLFKRPSIFLPTGILGIAGIGYLFSGKDDNYNTIEGLNHQGIARQKRQELTPFGSGWDSLRNFTKVGEKFTDMLKSSELKQAIQSGTHIKLLGKGVSGEAHLWETTFRGKSFRYVKKTGDPENLEAMERLGETVGPTLYGREGSDIFMEYISGTSLKEHFELKPQSIPVLLNKTDEVLAAAHQAGVSHGDIHLGNMMLTQEGKVALIDFGRSSPNLNRAAEDITSLQINKSIAREQYELSNMMRNLPRDLRGTPERAAWAKTLNKHRISRHRFSGKDDAANTVEGLLHGGFAEIGRRNKTPFSSGWDSLRNLIKGTETFRQMTSSRGFHQALEAAVPISRVGKGAMGEAWRMRTSFRDQSFDFIRKTGQIGEEEAGVMKAFQDKFAPTMYRESISTTGTPFIDMEFIQGKTAAAFQDTGQLTEQHISSIRKSLGEMHEMGLGHGDPHLNNVMVTPTNQIALIDYGTAGRLGEEFTSYSKAGRFQLTVNNQTTRSVKGDLNKLNESLTPKTPSNINATKKLARAALQRQTAAVSWMNGTTGGRRSRTD